MSISNQTISGLKWTFIETFVLKGSLFLITIFLARIVGPKEFGLMGLLSIFIALGLTLVESGLSLSLIRTKNSDQEDFSTVFFTNLIFSIVIYFLFFISAPYISNFFNQPLLVNLIRVYCLSFILSAFSSIQTTILVKELKFKILTILNFPGTIIGIIVSLILVYQNAGIWSIVWMYLSSQFINVLLLWKYSSWKPEFIFSKSKFKQHFNYGYKLMLAAVLDTIFKNSYNVVIGKLYPLKYLGYYDRSQTLNEYPVSVLTGIINKVSYPILSLLQDQNERITSSYKKLIKTSFFVTAPLMLSSAAIAQPLFLLVLGKEWSEASIFFQILCLASVFYPIHAFNITVLKVYGRTDLYLKLEVIKKIIIIVCILLSLNYGIYGLLWSNVFSSLIALIINTYYSGKMINYPLKQQLLDMFPILFSSTLMAISIFYFLYLLQKQLLIIQILFSLVFGWIFYLILNLIFNRQTIIFILQGLKSNKKST